MFAQFWFAHSFAFIFVFFEKVFWPEFVTRFYPQSVGLKYVCPCFCPLFRIDFGAGFIQPKFLARICSNILCPEWPDMCVAQFLFAHFPPSFWRRIFSDKLSGHDFLPKIFCPESWPEISLPHFCLPILPASFWRMLFFDQVFWPEFSLRFFAQNVGLTCVCPIFFCGPLGSPCCCHQCICLLCVALAVHAALCPAAHGSRVHVCVLSVSL